MWTIVLTLVGYFAQGNMDLIVRYSHEFSIIVVACLCIGILYFIFKSKLKKKK
jgi:membrane protein DedA with SNARE-associated domain